MLAAQMAKNNKHQQKRGQCQRPTARKECGNFMRNSPMDVSKGTVLLSPCSVNCKEFKAFAFQESFSKSATATPRKTTSGNAHLDVKRKCAMELVTTSFWPCSETSATGIRPQNPVKDKKHKEVAAIQAMKARTTSMPSTWQFCFATSGVARIRRPWQLLQVALWTGHVTHRTALACAAACRSKGSSGAWLTCHRVFGEAPRFALAALSASCT